MTELEKIIKGLEIQLDDLQKYADSDEILTLTQEQAKEIVAFLKEQDAVEPKCKERMGGFVTGVCPTCGAALNNVHNAKACGKCGQAVKWE